MGFFTKKSFDDIRKEFAQLLVKYGYIKSVYDLVIVIVEKKERNNKTGDYFITFEVHAKELDEDYLGSSMYIPGTVKLHIGRGLTLKHAMQNLYCNAKEVLEPSDEIEDCYG
jgi:hypothetical protein